MIDGGVWANNLVMNAVVDALACFDVPRENLRVLSLGTGDGTFTVEPTAQNGGIAQWGFLRSFSAAARAQSKNALGQAYLLIGKSNVLRIDVPESDQPIPMDDLGRSLNELPLVASSMAEASGQHIKGLFLSEVVQPFVTCSKVSVCS